MEKTYHRWEELRKKKLTPQQLAAIDRDVEHELIAMDVRAVNEKEGAWTNTSPKQKPRPR
jgi:hypothetical protein